MIFKFVLLILKRLKICNSFFFTQFTRKNLTASVIILISWTKVDIFKALALREKCPYLELFWSVFFRICTESGSLCISDISDIPVLSVSTDHSVSLHIQSKCGKIRTRITLNTDIFDTVWFSCTTVKWHFRRRLG